MNVLDKEMIDKLRRITGDAFAAIVRSYIGNARDLFRRVDEALGAHDLKEVERAAHSLKSASGQIGASAVQKSMAAVEIMAMTGKEGSIAPLVVMAKREFEEAAAELLVLI